jgi:hypothetical protein
LEATTGEANVIAVGFLRQAVSLRPREIAAINEASPVFNLRSPRSSRGIVVAI